MPNYILLARQFYLFLRFIVCGKNKKRTLSQGHNYTGSLIIHLKELHPLFIPENALFFSLAIFSSGIYCYQSVCNVTMAF